MAEGKKSFIAYSDWKATFDELSDEDAGRLIKHIFAYVNDENPVTDNVLIRVAFAQFKQTLKRDLVKWNEQLQQRRDAGKRSAEKRALEKSNERSTVVESRQRNSTDSVSVSVSVSDNVNDNVSEKEKKNKERANKFAPPTQSEVISYFLEKGYTQEAACKAFDYYDVANWTDSKGTKIKNWKQKMIAVWFKEENKAGYRNPNQPPKRVTPDPPPFVSCIKSPEDLIY